MKSKVIFISAVIVALVCTVALYCLAFEEYGKLFFINVSVACLAEVIVLFNVPLLSSGRFLTFKNSLSSGICTSYAALMFVWTTVVSLLMGSDSSFRALYIGMIVLTLVFVVSLAVIELAANSAQQQSDAVDVASRSRTVSVAMLVSSLDEIKDIARSADDRQLGNSISQLAISVEKLATIPVAQLERNKDILDDGCKKLSEIRQLLECGDAVSAVARINEFKRYALLMKNNI